MQNRYTGDIGDFAKLGLLRALSGTGLSLGVNWYLTPDESHNNDGKHTDYLYKERFRKCDEQLWDTLRNIVESEQREVTALERTNLIPARYYSAPMRVGGQTRKAWHMAGLDALCGADVVFVDPDNGLMVPSALGTPRAPKYVEIRELVDYYRHGSSLIYYQHKARRPDSFYLEQHRQLVGMPELSEAVGFGLKFRTTSQRYFFFIIQPRHREAIVRQVDKLLTSAWKEHFSLMPVTDARNKTIQERGTIMNETRKVVISVLGTDKKGIIAQVSRILYENDANILDITQTIVSGLFSMILIADVSSPECSFDALKAELDALGERIGVQIRTQRSEIFEAMHQI